MTTTMSLRILCTGAAVMAAVLGGCAGADWSFGSKGGTAEPQVVPEPINLMLPQSIRIHPFTGARTFDEAGGIRGLDVRIEAVDSYGDPAKAFGDFRFEMYEFKPNSLDPKGKRIASWDEPLLEPEKNLLHWDKITHTYEFKLEWDKPIPVGRRFVLVAYFSSPFTERMENQRVFISGQ